MHEPPRILVVDDVAANIEIVQMRLEAEGYEIATAVDGEDALAKAFDLQPDLILLDVMMPKLDGLAVVGRLKRDEALRFVPVILLTARSDMKDVLAGLEAGADDYIVKPPDHQALVARVRSMLRIKSLHDVVQAQAKQLQAQAEHLTVLNQTLEQRVADQVNEVERLGRLRRFLAPQVANLIASADNAESLLQSHRREITVVFCDLRGFTAFTDTAEPEDVLTVLSEYHKAVGETVYIHEGALERFAGDGILTLFNDPVPCPDHPERAVRMALEIRARVEVLQQEWRRRGHDIGLGIGIALGYATLGQIGFDQRREYAAVGSVTNLASRLCDEAKPSQIVVTRALLSRIETQVEYEPLGNLTLKGFHRAIAAFEIRAWR